MNSREPSAEPLSETTTFANSGSAFTSLSANTESSAVAIFSLSFQQTTITSTRAIASRLHRFAPGDRREGVAVLQVRPDEAVEVAFEHRLRAAGLDVRAQVLHHLVRVQDVVADLRAPLVRHPVAAQLVQLRLLLLARALHELRAQDPHRDVAVLHLRALLLRGDDDPGRQMVDANRGLRLVDVLTAGAARLERLDLEIFRLDLDVGVAFLHLGNDVDLGERRLPPPLVVERRDPHQPVDAALALEHPVRVLPANDEGDGAQAGLVARHLLDDVRLV